MGRTGFRVVPKMENSNTVTFWLVITATNETRMVGKMEVPHDGQMNDNLEMAQDVCKAMTKRIRKSV